MHPLETEEMRERRRRVESTSEKREERKWRWLESRRCVASGKLDASFKGIEHDILQGRTRV